MTLEMRRGPKRKLMGRDIRETLGQRSYPPCFDTQSAWKEWSNLNMLLSAESRAHFCTDCTARYRDAMTRQSKCVNPTFAAFEQ